MNYVVFMQVNQAKNNVDANCFDFVFVKVSVGGFHEIGGTTTVAVLHDNLVNKDNAITVSSQPQETNTEHVCGCSFACNLFSLKNAPKYCTNINTKKDKREKQTRFENRQKEKENL